MKILGYIEKHIQSSFKIILIYIWFECQKQLLLGIKMKKSHLEGENSQEMDKLFTEGPKM